jgi:hypothetical protein
MRRHPVAVYRIIDEQELLGGEDVELSSRRELAGSDARSRALRRQHRRGWSGWGWTTLGVVALACVAGLLLMVSPPARAPLPASSLHPGTTTSAPHAVTVVPAAMPAHTLPLHALRGRTRRVIVRRGPRPRARRLAGTVTRASSPVAVSRAGGPVTPPTPSAPDLEFGFER